MCEGEKIKELEEENEFLRKIIEEKNHESKVLKLYDKFENLKSKIKPLRNRVRKQKEELEYYKEELDEIAPEKWSKVNREALKKCVRDMIEEEFSLWFSEEKFEDKGSHFLLMDYCLYFPEEGSPDYGIAVKEMMRNLKNIIETEIEVEVYFSITQFYGRAKQVS
jgi:chromosome segregation ATPase